ncbi:hypothetical protein DSOUD_2278 [Desulfuromonas soudanensis]|uniref:PKD domain-containing protein n=1 Tax=Desulfuromonas soudanensis TaxID=1603606 RepID=A0A0M4DAA5_9BACT|nr:PKD domain-containing protein [Desulfuromonas soudanensis]ALC17042.1 hypothetical protein DSOUD_2278 [Desulfuromonas soudanensis]
MNARRTVRFLLLLVLLCAPGYALAVCPDAISPTSDAPGKAAINDLGEVVWSQKVDTPEVGIHYQLFSSTRGQLTFDAATNVNPSINKFGTVVWQKDDGIRNSIWVNDLGTVREIFPDGQTPAINDGGEIVFVKSGEIFSSLRGVLGTGADPDINNNGDVVWSNLDSTTGFVQIYGLNSGETLPTPLTSDGVHHNWPSISNDGEVVWVQNDGSGNDRVFSSAGQLTSDCPAVQYHRNPSVNSCGDLVFTSWDSGVTGQPGEVYRLGTSAPCGASEPPAGGMCGQQGLPVPILADLPTPSKRTAINDLGEMLWSERDINGWLQIHSNKRGQLTSDPSHHEFPALNNYGVLVWQQYELDFFSSSIVKSDGGTPVTVAASGMHPSINDAGEVVYEDWGAIYSSIRTSLEIPGTFPDINNRGDLVCSAFDANDNSQIYRLDYGTTVPVQVTFEPTEHYSPSINDSGEVVYEQFNISGQNRIVSSTRGALTSSCPLDVVHLFPDINSCGDVAFLGADDMFEPTTGTVYRLGETLPCYTFLPTSAPALDSDKDGLPDVYENAHGLDPLVATDALSDLDGDGISNFAEFAAGTDPNNNQDEPGVPGLTVLPSTVVSGTGPVSLTVGNLPTGGVVILSLTFDADNSGTVNGDEWPMVVEGVADGGTAGENFTADSSTALGTLATTFGASPRWGMLGTGQYIVRAEVPGGLFSLGTFTVTAATGSKQISGYVASGSEEGTPIGNALVVFTTGSAPERIVSFAFTNDTGNYTLQINDSLPVSGKLSAVRGAGGFLQSPATAVTVETTSSLDIPLVLLPSDATVIGRVLSYDDGRPVFGARVRGSSALGHAAEAVTDSNGDFVLAALGAAPPGLSWTLETDVPPGYFAAVEATSGLFLPQASLVLNPGGISHLGFWAFPDTAWLKGQFKDETNLHTIAGAGLFVSRDANELDPVQRNLRTDGTSDANGLAIIGLNPGSWWAIAETPGKLMVNGVPRDLVPQAAVAVVPDLLLGQTREMTFNPYYADGIIEGHVFYADGSRAENIVVTAETGHAKNGVDKIDIGPLYSEVKTDALGYFRIPVLEGIWTVRATDYDNGTGTISKEKIIDVITNGDDIIDDVEIYDWNALVLVGNLCSNGIQDPGETGIDTGGSCDPVLGGLPPVAAFTFSPLSPLYCQNVTLNASTSTGDPEWPIESYKWDVTGDGLPDFVGEILTYGFGSAGDHEVTLYVKNELDQIDFIKHTITTQDPHAPVADAGGPYVISAGASLDLIGSGSYHPDADCSISMTYDWEVDGDNLFDDASGVTTTVPWADLVNLPRDQALPLYLEVVDNADVPLSDVDTATLTIKMPVASFTFTPPSAPPYCTGVPLDGSGSIHPNGETLVNYAWDINSDGTFEFNSATPGYNFEAPAPGTHTLTLKVTDSYGMTATYSDNVITDTYQTPVAAHGGPYFVDDGQELTLDASATVHLDGACGDGLKYSWDFGKDGTYEVIDQTSPTVAILWTQLSAFPRDVPIPLRVKVEHSADPTRFSTADTNFTISKLTAAFTSGPAPVSYCGDFPFDASTSTHSNPARTLSYAWDMDNDGQFDDVFGETPTYKFSTPGDHLVTLQVTDDLGWTDTIGQTITTAAVRAPVASIGGPYVADEGQPLLLNGELSTHPDAACGNTLAYNWDTNNDGIFGDLTGAAPSIPWTQLSGYTREAAQPLALRVEDASDPGLNSLDTTDFKVSQLTAAFTSGPAPVSYCTAFPFDASTSTVTSTTRTISTYEWDFDNDLVFTDAAGMTQSHVFAAPDTSYTVGLRVTDSNGWSAVYSAPVVTAPYQTPVAAHGGPYFVDDGQVLTLDAGASVQLDGNCGDTLVYSWDFNSDGTYETTSTTATVAIPWEQISAFSRNVAIPLRVKVEHSADPTKFSTADTTLTITKLTAAFTSGPAPVSYCGAFPFDASTSAHSNAIRTIQSYAWDFDNDGAFDDGTGEFPTYSFSTAGNHLVSLKVTDDLGWTATTSVEITTAAVRAPVALIGGSYVADEGQPLLLNGGASSHLDAACGNTLVYSWDTNNDGIFGDLTGATPSIPWTQLSGYTREAAQPLALRVEDADDPGLNTLATTTFRVSELTAAFTSGPAPVSYCTAFPFDASSSTVTSATRTIANYEWDFNNDGVFPDATGITQSHVFADPATTYTVGLRVTDSNGWSTTTTRTLTTAVVQTPIAAVVGSYSIKTGENLVLKGDLSSHPDAGCGRSLTYAWDIDGDGYDDAFVPNPTIYWAVLNGYEKGVNLPLSLKVTDSAISTLFGTNDGSWAITKIDALPPSALIVPAVSTGTQVPLSWTASTTPGATYTIVESRNVGFTDISRTLTGFVGTSTTLTQNTAGPYFYRIMTVAPGYFDSTWAVGGNSCNVNPYAPTPGNVSVPMTSTGNQVTINWTTSGPTGVTYTVVEARDAGFTDISQTVSGITTPPANLTQDVQGTYYYRVKATADGYLESTWGVGSNSCTVVTTADQPGSFVVPASSTTGAYTLTWTVPAIAEGFEIEESTTGTFTGVPTYTLPTAVASFDVTGKAPGTYSYQIRATKTGLISSAWVSGGAIGCNVPDADGDGVADGLDICNGNDATGDTDVDLTCNDLDTDDDGDGLPDAWEITYTLDPLDATGINGAAGNPDNDSFTNLEEFINVTNPRVENDLPTAVLTAPVAGFLNSTTPTISWNQDGTGSEIAIAELYVNSNGGGYTLFASQVNGAPIVTPLAQGSHDFKIVVTDAAGNIGESAVVTVTVDSISPVLTMRINDLAASQIATNNETVTLYLTCDELGGSACDQVRFSNDGTFDSLPEDWQTVGPTALWTLTAGEGSKTVWGEGKDLAGNIHQVTAVIELDQTKPVITMVNPLDNPQNVFLGNAYVEAGATVSDNFDTGLSAVIDASAVVTSVVGDYPVYYDVTDAAGNAAVRVVRTVHVFNQAQQPSLFTVPTSSTTGDFTLSWTASADAEGYEIEESTTGTFTGTKTYDVLLGADETYLVTGRAPGTYYYQIRAVHSVMTPSDWVQSGSGCRVDELKVLSPNGGETLQGRSTITIIWHDTSETVSYEIRYSTNSGASWTTIVTLTSPSSTFDWTVPDLASVANQCLVQVLAYDDRGVVLNSDVSDETFTINVPVTVTYPNAAGLVLSGGQNTNVNWSAATNAVSYELSYSVDGGTTWVGISTVAAPTLTTVWSIPILSSQATQCLVRVRARNDLGVVMNADVSNNFFTINVPVSVTYPNAAGLVLSGGQNTNVNWSAATNAVSYELSYSLNGGTTWVGISTVAAPTLTTVWSIPIPASQATQCLVRVRARNDLGVVMNADVSNNFFTINVPVSVTYPNAAGLVLSGGQNTNVNWSAATNAVSYELSYSLNGGTTWVGISTVAAPTLTTVWSIPIPASQVTQCLVRVRARNDLGVVMNADVSNNFFTINVPVSVTYPNAAGLVLSGGQNTNVNWSAATNAVSYELSYSLNGGTTWVGISTVAAPTLTTVWSIPIPASQATQCLVRVRARNDLGVVMNADVSNNFFTINVPVSVTYPNAAGLVLSGGQNTNVNWSAATNAVSYELSYSLDGGTTWVGISTVAAPALTTVWSIPNPASQATQCLVRVRARNDSGGFLNQDICDNTFTINVSSP